MCDTDLDELVISELVWLVPVFSLVHHKLRLVMSAYFVVPSTALVTYHSIGYGHHKYKVNYSIV